MPNEVIQSGLYSSPATWSDGVPVSGSAAYLRNGRILGMDIDPKTVDVVLYLNGGQVVFGDYQTPTTPAPSGGTIAPLPTNFPERNQSKEVFQVNYQAFVNSQAKFVIELNEFDVNISAALAYLSGSATTLQAYRDDEKPLAVAVAVKQATDKLAPKIIEILQDILLPKIAVNGQTLDVDRTWLLTDGDTYIVPPMVQNNWLKLVRRGVGSNYPKLSNPHNIKAQPQAIFELEVTEVTMYFFNEAYGLIY